MGVKCLAQKQKTVLPASAQNLQWATKVFRHLAVKSDFRSFKTFPPLPPKRVDFFIS